MGVNAADQVKEYLANNYDAFTKMSDYVFDHPELRFAEYKSAEFLALECEKAGFEVERGVANIETAFVATYGSGSPVIGFLGEYDALSGLGQVPNETSPKPNGNANGHGCGHNLLGVGAFAAACATKNYLEENNLPGTVKFFGCPAEEGGSGKTYMVREGVFDEVDIALTWHPADMNGIMSVSSLANYQVYFQFEGVSSHAAGSPHLGRSALDAVELMNSGVNYLREHVVPEARMHYAVTNTGGISPNVVQANAEVLYLLRAPEVHQVDDIFKRVIKIAEGAALMTETKMTMRFDKACSNYIPNRKLEEILYDSLKDSSLQEPTPEENAFAKGIWESLTENEQEGYLTTMTDYGYNGDGSEFEGKYVSDLISPYTPADRSMAGSTDVADVSWVVPTAQVATATCAIGTPAHTWQMTAQGKSSIAYNGMLRVAEAMSKAAIHLFNNKEDYEKVREEFEAFKAAHPYTCPIPANVQPTILK
ncbi:M20 family metallopeptidase [Ornithinibacillus sp. 4-3]|uniref:M20 family metallopeptidase n=1 Tax=Ornithinibacillus sp. 4-3 TaxID=3231488 RepID=A0AB39HNN3_9BACI